jgi:hypothetical protein
VMVKCDGRVHVDDLLTACLRGTKCGNQAAPLTILQLLRLRPCRRRQEQQHGQPERRLHPVADAAAHQKRGTGCRAICQSGGGPPTAQKQRRC